MTLTVASLCALFAAGLTELVGQTLRDQVRADVRTTGSLLAQFVRERGQSMEMESKLLLRVPVLKAYIQIRDRATLLDIMADDRKALRIDSILLTDRDGQILAETGTPKPIGADTAAFPGIAAAMNGVSWTGVVMCGNHIMLAASVPFRIGPEVWGTVTAFNVVDVGMLDRLDAADRFDSEFAFVDHGRIVSASRPLASPLPMPQRTPTVVTVGGRRYYALYAPLPGAAPKSGIGFVVLRDYNQSMAIYRRFQTVFTVSCVLMLLLALVAGTVVAQQITAPLALIGHAAHELRQGHWPERIPVRRNDEVGLLQSVFNDMAETMHASQDRLLSLIDTDILTGLDNHRRFQERLAQEATRCVTYKEPLSVLLLDLDHFQQVNHVNGHAAGDAALKQVAEVLREVVPEVGICARYGGDEFTVLLPQHTLLQAEQVAEQLRARILALTPQSGEEPTLSASIGCAQLDAAILQVEGLLLAAELAVSRAKQLGRNRVCRFDSVPGANEFADPQKLHRFLKDSSLATIQALAAAVDAKDSYTRGHSQRVAEIASDLARYVGLPEADVDLISTMGTLHDVGKIGVPDAILQKPGKLTEEEFAILATHPILGEVIVRKAPQLEAVLPGVRHHHERWDGRGYPDRLRGEAIPLAARVLALADTFDAMTSNRPYRNCLSVEVALREIGRCSGTQFDPALAPAFVRMIEGTHRLREE